MKLEQIYEELMSPEAILQELLTRKSDMEAKMASFEREGNYQEANEIGGDLQHLDDKIMLVRVMIMQSAEAQKRRRVDAVPASERRKQMDARAAELEAKHGPNWQDHLNATSIKDWGDTPIRGRSIKRGY